MKSKNDTRNGFTLVETMVAISLLTVAIVAPMALTAQSLGSAYYARDQVTAYYLAQEAIESVRAIRDGQILCIAKNDCPAGNNNLFGAIPNNTPFRIDVRTGAIHACNADPGGNCIPLQTDGTLYGYQDGGPGTWTNTNFTRTAIACYVQSDGTCTGTPTDEMQVRVTVSWQTEGIQARTFTISSDLYRWINDGSGV